MKPYIIKFKYFGDGSENIKEEMFLCLHGSSYRDAAEKFWQVTGGESRGNYLTSVIGPDKIETFWNRDDWKFYTIPTD